MERGADFFMADMTPGAVGRGEQALTDDDLPLLERVLTGDTQAFEEIVGRHKVRVYRATFAITGNAQDAEEAMQDAFMKAYQHLHEFQRASKFSTWLTRIAVNEGLQRRRRRKPTVSIDEVISNEDGVMPKQFEDWHDTPEKIYSKQQTREIVERAIQSLKPIYREVFVLRDVQGLSTEETAEALGVSIANVKSRLLRARLMMRELLAPHFQRRLTLQARLRKTGWKLQDAVLSSLRRVSSKREEM